MGLSSIRASYLLDNRLANIENCKNETEICRGCIFLCAMLFGMFAAHSAEMNVVATDGRYDWAGFYVGATVGHG